MTETRILQTPAKYIQGPNLIRSLGKYVAPFGKKFLILTEDFIFDMKRSDIETTFRQEELSYEVVSFRGECCRTEINRVAEICKSISADAVIGFGGGKVLDTGKYAAYLSGVPYISAPSVSSTDAPCTSVVVIYTDTGEVEISTNVSESPRVIIVDSQMIADAPLRLFVAGMGDALSTYFEARTSYELGEKNILGGEITISAMTMARASFDVLMQDGAQAKRDLENKQLTECVERVIEADTLLSGIGFESGGLSAAHGIHNAMKNQAETHKIMHGELVAFGTLCLLAIENRGDGFLEQSLQFCHQVGLPTTLAEIGFTSSGQQLESTLRQVAFDATQQAPKYHMPANATKEVIYDAIVRVDQLGRALKSGGAV